MKDQIFKLTLKNLGHYRIRLLPNINDEQNLKVTFKATFGQMGWNQNHILYALVNDEIKVFVAGNVVMSKTRNYSDDYREQLALWDIEKSVYLDINTSNNHGFLKVDIDYKEDKKYNYKKNKDYIINLLNSIKHIKLEDVLYQELFLIAERKWENNYTGTDIYMKDVYNDEYPDFEERYKVWLRSKKIKQIVG